MKKYFHPLSIAFLLTFCTLVSWSPVSAQSFTTVASATSQGGNCWQITPNQTNRNGAIWSTNTINLNNPFDITFHVTQSVWGADGMAFVLQNNGTNVIGGGGSNIGYAGGTITNSVAVELDIWDNIAAGIDDLTQDHLAVHVNGVLNNAELGPVTALASGGDVTDGVCRPLRVIWNPGSNNFQVWFNGAVRINGTYNIRTPFGSNPNVHFGITAATGGVGTEQSVCYQFANAGPDTSICVNTSLQLNASGGTNYGWFPTFGLTSSNTPNPTFTPYLGVNSYPYILTVQNQQGCTDEDTLTIVTEALPTANAGGNSTICDGDSVQIGTAAQAGLSYSWSPVAGLSDPNVAQPMTSPPNTITYTLTVTDLNGIAGCTANDQVTVTVLPSPVANAGPDQSICLGTGTQIGTPANSFTNYSWSPTTGLSAANVARPTASPTVTTTYIVTTTLTLSNCQRTDTVVVTVNTPPTADAGPDVALCEGSCDTLGVAPVSGMTYSWSPSTELNNGGISNPRVCPTATRTYTLIQTQLSTACKDTDTVVVNLNANPIVNAGQDTSLCAGACIVIGPAPVAGQSCVWSPATGLNDPNISNPTTCPTSNICYSVICTDTATGCGGADTLCITVNALPFVDAGPDLALCVGDTTQLGGNADTSATVSWSPVTGLSDPLLIAPSAYPGSSQTYLLTATDLNGCTNQDTMDLTVNPLPTAAFNYGSSQLQVTFTNTSSPGTYFWDFGDGNTDTATSPVHTYDTSGTYTACLTVTDANGCENELCQNITVMGVGIAEPDLSGRISLYPNPGSGLFYLDLSELNGETAEVEVYTLHGQSLLHLPPARITAERIPLDLSRQANGVYWVKIKTSAGTAVLKWIKH